MKTSVGTILSVLAVAGLALPVQADNQPVPSAAPSVADIALTADGNLSGAVVRPDGKPLSNTAVQVLYKQNVVAEVKSDANGRYTVRGLRNGVHTVRSAGIQKVCRFWSASTAPRTAKKGLILSRDARIIRGQGDSLLGGLGNPAGAALFFGTTAATIIAIENAGSTPSVAPASP